MVIETSNKTTINTGVTPLIWSQTADKTAKISIIGSGYVGLVMAVGFASSGYNTICLDYDESKVSQINNGVSPIYEDLLSELLSSCITKSNRLRATSDYDAILDTDITFICVDTHCNANGAIDLSRIEGAVEQIGRTLSQKESYHTVVVKSTVVPGTTEQFIIPLLEKHSGKRVGQNIGVAVNPEFLQEGKAIYCFFKPDRIVIGESDRKAGDVVEGIFSDFPTPIFRTNMTTAEMIKYTSNVFLATKISFVNEIGNICQKLGVDVYTVVEGISYDPRIGNKFMNAGVGFGGSCLPKDIRALIHASNEIGYKPKLLESVLEVNETQALKMVELAEEKLGNLKDKKVAVLGLAFKPNTNDLRGAPALKVIKALLQEGASVNAYDPEAMPNAKQILSADSVNYCDTVKEAIDNSDCILILTEWTEFKNEELYRGKVVIDGRRIFNPQSIKTICEYKGVCW